MAFQLIPLSNQLNLLWRRSEHPQITRPITCLLISCVTRTSATMILTRLTTLSISTSPTGEGSNYLNELSVEEWNAYSDFIKASLTTIALNPTVSCHLHLELKFSTNSKGQMVAQEPCLHSTHPFLLKLAVSVMNTLCFGKHCTCLVPGKIKPRLLW